MDKRIAGAIGVAAALATFDAAHAATLSQLQETMAAASYADLLQPIPNATALLKASDSVLDAKAATENDAKIEMAQFFHDHHHHHRFYRRFYHHHRHHHHHHHHHHHGFFHDHDF